MASTKLSDYRMSIFINNDQAKRSLIEMEKVMQGYEAELNRLRQAKMTDTEEYRKAKKVYDDHLAKMQEMRKEAGLQAFSIKELKSLRIQLNNELARTVPGTEGWIRIRKEISAVNARLHQLNNSSKETRLSFGRIADGFNKYFTMATAGIAALAGFAFSIKNLITAQGELDDSLANIRKTTGMTAKEVQDLNKQLGKIDTRTSRQELREMAVVAGQLGIQKNQIYDFVDAVDKLNVALGDEIKGGAEEVSKTMGTLRNVLTDMKSANISNDMLRIGNAINELGAAGFATAPVVADFANRIGGIGIQLGLTSDEVLGLSATLQELNVSTERGGTAVSKILQKMTTNVADFAKIAGLPVKEFTDLVNRDLFGAFVKVLEGSKKGGEGATVLAGVIKDLEITGAGASEVFAKVGNNIDMLREKVGLAGKSLQGTDSIMNEFNIKNATLGATIAKLQKDFYSLITMPGVTEFFKNQVYHVVELIGWFKNLPNFIERYKVAIIALTGAFGVWIAAKTRAIQVSLAYNIVNEKGWLIQKIRLVQVAYEIAMENLRAATMEKTTVRAKASAAAQLLWNAALKANPIGIFITAITALIGAITIYERNSKRAIELENQKASMTVLLTNANSKLESSYSKISGQIRNLNQMSIEQRRSLQEETNSVLKRAEAELTLFKAKQKNIGKQAAEPSFFQSIKASFSGVGYSGQKENYDYYAWKNQKEAMAEFDDDITKLESQISQLKTEKKNLDDILNAESIADSIVVKTISALEEKQSRYQTALKNTVAGSEEYIRIQEKIKNVNKELAKFNNADTSNPANYEKDKKAFEDHNKELLNIRRKIQDLSIEMIRNGQERELKLNELAYQRELEAIKGNSAEEQQLRELLLQQKLRKDDDINKKYSDEAIARAVKIEEEKWKAIINADIKGSESWRANSLELLEKQKQLELQAIGLTDEEIQAIKDKYDAMRSAISGDTALVGPEMPDDFSKPAEGNLIQRSGADKAGLDFSERIAALKTQRDIELEMAQGNVDAQQAIWEEFYASQNSMIAGQINNYAAFAQQIVSAMSGVNQAMSDYENAQLKKDENANEKKKANLKKRLDSGQITQKQYNDQVAKLDADLDAKKKELSIKQAKRQKALSLAQAIINVAQAVTSALSAGPIIGIILAALVGILGAIQIGYIASTPIPEAAKGRYAAFRKARQAAAGRYRRAKDASMGRYNFLREDDPVKISADADSDFEPRERFSLKKMFRTAQAARGRYAMTGLIPQAATGRYKTFEKEKAETDRTTVISGQAPNPSVHTTTERVEIIRDQYGNQIIPQAATGRYETFEKDSSSDKTTSEKTTIDRSSTDRTTVIPGQAPDPSVRTTTERVEIIRDQDGNQIIPQAAIGRYETFEKDSSSDKTISEKTTIDQSSTDRKTVTPGQGAVRVNERLNIIDHPWIYDPNQKIYLDLGGEDRHDMPAKTAQAASGRYSVTGQDDNKLYRDVPYVPQPESGIYYTPTLFAETGREIILNPKHTENLIRFRPDLVYQIMQVPQRAEGYYQPAAKVEPGNNQPVMVSFDPETLAALQEFKENVKKPLRAEMTYDTVVDTISRVDTITDEATR